MPTIRRPLYSGSGWALYNGAGTALTWEVTVPSQEEETYRLLTELRAVVGGPGSTIAGILTSQIATTPAAGIWPQIIQAIIDAVSDLLFGPSGPSGAVATIDDLVPITDWIANPTNILTPIAAIAADIADGVDVNNLPSPAPGGYGGADASEVWSYDIPQVTRSGNEPLANAWANLQNAASGANAFLAGQGIVDPRNPVFSLSHLTGWAGATALFDAASGDQEDPMGQVDWTEWDGTEDIAALLNRLPATSAWTWHHYPPIGGVPTPSWAWASGLESSQVYWRCLVSNEMLPYVSGQLAVESVPQAPIWPGISAVTLGTPVPLTSNLVLVGPMHGILVTYTTPPSGVSVWQIGGYKSYSHTGQVAFVTDNDDAEQWQYLQFDAAIYVPRTMRLAASALVRGLAGVQGSVTPWTID